MAFAPFAFVIYCDRVAAVLSQFLFMDPWTTVIHTNEHIALFEMWAFLFFFPVQCFAHLPVPQNLQSTQREGDKIRKTTVVSGWKKGFLLVTYFR